MKHVFLALSVAIVCIAYGCKDDVAMEPEFDYHAHIHSPNTMAKHIDDVLHIDVEFESHTGMTVHHINVRIFNKATGVDVYNKPDDPHVHESSGTYPYEDDFSLSVANGVIADADYILEAKVWGHDDGVEEVMEQVEFHVEP